MQLILGLFFTGHSYWYAKGYSSLPWKVEFMGVDNLLKRSHPYPMTDAVYGTVTFRNMKTSNNRWENPESFCRPDRPNLTFWFVCVCMCKQLYLKEQDTYVSGPSAAQLLTFHMIFSPKSCTSAAKCLLRSSRLGTLVFFFCILFTIQHHGRPVYIPLDLTVVGKSCQRVDSYQPGPGWLIDAARVTEWSSDGSSSWNFLLRPS